MYKKVWQNLYSFIIIPLIFTVTHILCIFSKQIRAGLFPRRKSVEELQLWLAGAQINGKHVLIHAASLGEFEHIKPLLQQLKEQYRTTNVVTFFSPSGYKNVKVKCKRIIHAHLSYAPTSSGLFTPFPPRLRT